MKIISKQKEQTRSHVNVKRLMELGRDICVFFSMWRLYWRTILGRKRPLRLAYRSLVQHLPVMRKYGRYRHGGNRNNVFSADQLQVGSIVDIDGVKVRLHPDLSQTMREVVARGRLALEERQIVLPVLEKDDVVVELGGGIGVLTTACAKRIGSDRVFAYEANPELKPIAEDTYELNKVNPTIAFCMLGETEGEESFYVSKNFWASSVYGDGDNLRKITVPVRSFNREMERIMPTFLIIDIEGAEEALFEYANLTGVRKIMLETHPQTIGVRRSNSIRRKLRYQGFTEHTDDCIWFLYARSETSAA